MALQQSRFGVYHTWTDRNNASTVRPSEEPTPETHNTLVSQEAGYKDREEYKKPEQSDTTL